MIRIDAGERRESEPMKWKKHLALVNWRLRDREHLLRAIHRYPIADYMRCLQDIGDELATVGDGYSFIIKLVYAESYLKLPNIVITSAEELAQAYKTLASAPLSKFKEIWYCKNQTKRNDTVFGRVSFGNTLLFPSRSILRYEMVWGSSARRIEQYPLISNPFISIDRKNWNGEPMVDRISEGNMTAEQILDTAKRILAKIAVYTPEIIDFATFVFSRGCNHLCLEFSYGKDGFSFIDWDSDNDRKVLRE